MVMENCQWNELTTKNTRKRRIKTDLSFEPTDIGGLAQRIILIEYFPTISLCLFNP